MPSRFAVRHADPAAEVRHLRDAQLHREHLVVPPMHHGAAHLLFAQPFGGPA